MGVVALEVRRTREGSRPSCFVGRVDIVRRRRAGERKEPGVAHAHTEPAGARPIVAVEGAGRLVVAPFAGRVVRKKFGGGSSRPCWVRRWRGR